MSSKTILVVDDSRSEQRLIEAILKTTGHAVSIVDDAEQALDWMKRNVPDVLVLDVIMPGINGFDLCRRLRSNPKTEKIPIVFCTSKDQEFDRFWGLRQGGAAYVTKPFAPNELIDAVKTCLSAS